MNAVASAKEFLDGHAHKGNLLKGIDKKNVRREGIEFLLMLLSNTLLIA